MYKRDRGARDLVWEGAQMMVMSKEERRESRGRKLKEKIADMTDAGLVHRDFWSGRPALGHRSPAEAIRLAAVSLKELQSRMAAKGLDVNDCGVWICYVDLSFTMAWKTPYTPSKEEALEKDLAGKPVVMIGLLFHIRDRKAPNPNKMILVGVKPFFADRKLVDVFRDLIDATGDTLS
jgi:hypothetical protein